MSTYARAHVAAERRLVTAVHAQTLLHEQHALAALWRISLAPSISLLRVQNRHATSETRVTFILVLIVAIPQRRLMQ
jgi:hypothetical protein